MSQISNSAIFDGNELTSVEGLTVIATNPYRPPKRSLESMNLARTHKSKVASGYYTERIIAVRVAISRSTRGLLEQSIDTLMGLLQGFEKDLILPQANSTRRYICTYEDYIVNEDVEGGSYIVMDLLFNCSDRFGYELNPTVILNLSGQTDGSRADNHTFSGSAPTQTPIITITLAALTGGTNATLSVGNAYTGQLLAITRDWVAGDILVIDTNARTVKVNGVDVAFSGAFPEFKKGAGTITFSNTLTTRTFSYYVYYNRRWL